MMILGYGDGFAAIIGKRFRSKILLPGKSVAGSVTMLVASLLVTSLMLWLYQSVIVYPVLFVILIAVSATVIEMLTRHGLDNLTVPLGWRSLVTSISSSRPLVVKPWIFSLDS
jgi:phytol kinase